MVSVADIISDDRLFCERLIIIEDRNKNNISFIFNPAQEIIHNSITGRDIYVKASQIGSTTFHLARYFKKVITEPNTTAVVVAHEEFLTQRLLQRVNHMYDRLPLPGHLKPKMSHNSSYEMYFPDPLWSTFYIGTAGAKVFGRGEPIHLFLGSEFAFWPDPYKILIPTEQRVPMNGEMVIESTPNGEGSARVPNAFFEIVQEALDGKGIWNLIQLPWWLEDEYQLPIGSQYAQAEDKARITRYTDDEISLIKRIGWNDETADRRIRWRRRKIASIKQAFWQEFFEDIVSCFLSIAEPFYAPVDTDRLNSMCYPGDWYFNAEVWYPPVSREDNPVYVITIDPGQGKATRSVAQVWRMDGENFSRQIHCATLSGLYTNEAFAPQVMKLGEYYHNAKLVPEANGHGQGFTARVTEYPNLYYRTDIVSNIETRVIGWMTTGSTRIGSTGTKMYGIGELQALLPSITTHDINLVRELKQVRYSGGTITFLGSDDNHDAAMIMAATRSHHIGNPNRGLIGHAGHNF